jgi:RimJ/RimL family protein N-acetyltransferase
MADVTLFCTRETFRPCPSEGARWWQVEDWAAARDAHQEMWPRDDGWTFWSEEEWRRLYSEGYRYCDLLVDGRAVATAGLWPRTSEEWGPIAVGTAPAHRNKGYGKAIVSFVTRTILDAGRTAVIVTREDNAPMRRVAEVLGYELRAGRWLMKVADLIAALQRLDPDLEVLCCTEDEAMVPAGKQCALLDIVAASVVDTEWLLGDARLPGVADGASSAPRKFAVLHVTADF